MSPQRSTACCILSPNEGSLPPGIGTPGTWARGGRAQCAQPVPPQMQERPPQGPAAAPAPESQPCPQRAWGPQHRGVPPQGTGAAVHKHTPPTSHTPTTVVAPRPRWQRIPPPLPGTLPPLDPQGLPVYRPPRPSPTPGLPTPARRLPDSLTMLGEDIEAGLGGAPRQVPPAAGGPGCTAAPDPSGLRLLKPRSLPDAAHLLPHPCAHVRPRPRRPLVTFLLGSGLGLLGLLRSRCQSRPRP